MIPIYLDLNIYREKGLGGRGGGAMDLAKSKKIPKPWELYFKQYSTLYKNILIEMEGVEYPAEYIPSSTPLLRMKYIQVNIVPELWGGG